MVEQKDYLIEKQPHNIEIYPSLDHYRYFHKVIFKDIQNVAKIKIQKSKSKKINAFLDYIIKAGFNAVTWEYMFTTNSQNNFTLSKDYLYFLLFIFEYLNDAFKLKCYSLTVNLINIEFFVELFEMEKKNYFHSYLKYYLEHRKEIYK